MLRRCFPGFFHRHHSVPRLLLPPSAARSCSPTRILACGHTEEYHQRQIQGSISAERSQLRMAMRSLSPPEQLAFLEDERTRLHEDAARSISPERRVLKSSLSQSASPDKIRFLEEERCRLERSLSRSASCDTAVEELEVERVQVQEEEATAAPVPPRIAVLVQATEINQGECFWCSLSTGAEHLTGCHHGCKPFR